MTKTFKMKKLLLAVLVSLGLQTQAQITCDSVTTTYLNIGPDTIEVKTNLFDLGLNTFIVHAFDYYDNSGVSFYDTARHAFIPVPDPLISDTFSICNWSDFVQAPWSCFTCDTFVWNNGSWMMMSMMQGNTTSINELTFNRVNDNKIYDLLGRELTEIPVGKLYIRNQKLYITR